MTRIRLLSTLALMGAMRRILVDHPEVEADFAPTGAILERLAKGEPADLLALTQEAARDLLAKGELTEIADIATSSIGLAVAKGTTPPKLETAADLVAALKATPSIAYSRIGASGLFFADLLTRLGLKAEIDAKATITPGGLTAQRVLSGETAIAIQQMSELLVVEGIGPVTPLPADSQCYGVFTGGVPPGPNQAAAASFLKALTSPATAPILRASGLEPFL